MSIIYQLKIELAGIQPKVWRRITVPVDTPFDNLHDIIQIAMGWNNEYPFEFTINKTTVRDFGAEVDMREDPNDRDVWDTFLDELVTMVKTRFTYVYNLDDRMEHTITLEKISDSGEEPVYPVCMEGEGGTDVTFDLAEVNDRLRRYAEEWEEIDAETEKDMEDLGIDDPFEFNEEDDDEDADEDEATSTKTV